MSKVKIEDIVAYKRNNKYYCQKCAVDERLEEITRKETITRDDLEDSLETIFYCDFCDVEMMR